MKYLWSTHAINLLNYFDEIDLTEILVYYRKTPEELRLKVAVNNLTSIGGCHLPTH